MKLINTRNQYGLVAKLLHWIMAFGIGGLFASGLWMVELGYYDPWNKRAPELHKSFGGLMLLFLVMRLFWKLVNKRPQHDITPLETLISRLVQAALYLLVAAMVTSGYFISTADGRSLEVFNLITLPALLTIEGLESTAGAIHEYTAYVLIALSTAHGGAALKHHFYDKSSVFTSMWWHKR